MYSIVAIFSLANPANLQTIFHMPNILNKSLGRGGDELQDLRKSRNTSFQQSIHAQTRVSILATTASVCSKFLLIDSAVPAGCLPLQLQLSQASPLMFLLEGY